MRSPAAAISRTAFAAGAATALQGPSNPAADARRLKIAGAACEMHPAAIEKALARKPIAEQLQNATAAARAAGVSEVPSVIVAGQTFNGERELELAAAAASEEQTP